jgi:hypothetical protein
MLMGAVVVAHDVPVRPGMGGGDFLQEPQAAKSRRPARTPDSCGLMPSGADLDFLAAPLVVMEMIVRRQDRGALRLDHLHNRHYVSRRAR